GRRAGAGAAQRGGGGGGGGRAASDRRGEQETTRRKGGDMRQLLGFGATAALAFSAGLAGAAPLNFEGTLTITINNVPSMVTTGGGVATLNAAGGVPRHLISLTRARRRARPRRTPHVLVTAPR